MRDADGAADQALHHALGQELAQDVRLRGAHRAPDADLLGPLGDADQHHVHDHDAAHHRRDRADHDEHGEECRADALPQRDVAVRGADEEIVVLAGRHVAARAQDRAAPRPARAAKIFSPPSALTCSVRLLRCAAQFQVGAQRDDDEVVLVLAQHGADLFERPDDRELVLPSADRFPSGSASGKELAAPAVADQADVAPRAGPPRR